MTSWMRKEKCRVPEHLRCQALLRDSYMRPTNDRCRSHAYFDIDGRRLCAKHGEMHALEVMLKEGRAKESAPSIPSLRCRPRFVGEDEV